MRPEIGVVSSESGSARILIDGRQMMTDLWEELSMTKAQRMRRDRRGPREDEEGTLSGESFGQNRSTSSQELPVTR
jgi:hypothetical protein